MCLRILNNVSYDVSTVWVFNFAKKSFELLVFITSDRAKAVPLSSPLFYVCLTCIFNELMHDWWYECDCMCMSVPCLRDGLMFCVTFPACLSFFVHILDPIYILQQIQNLINSFWTLYRSTIKSKSFAYLTTGCEFTLRVLKCRFWQYAHVTGNEILKSRGILTFVVNKRVEVCDRSYAFIERALCITYDITGNMGHMLTSAIRHSERH